jgi:nucleotide-binding universal stress UspA family protein
MTAIKTLLVHADSGPRCGARLRAGRLLAERLQAQMHALYAVTPAFTQVPIELASGGSALLIEEIDESRLATARKIAQHVAAEPGARFQWHESRSQPHATFTRQARYADLLLLGQHDPANDGGVPSDFAESVLAASGRPALLLPYVDSVPTLGTTVLIAWKDTAEAARALSAALPLLQQAGSVHVATWGEDEDDPPESGMPGLREFLRAHGVEAALHRQAAAGAEVGELMQSLAADLSADLLVMGCYGHTRARELVLGGATRTVLRTMSLPVLMSH